MAIESPISGTCNSVIYKTLLSLAVKAMNSELQVARLGLFGRNSLSNKSVKFLSHIKKIISHIETGCPILCAAL